MQRREFQRLVIESLRNGAPATLDDEFFAGLETKANKHFPPGDRAEIARQWIDDLVTERILVNAGAGADSFQLNPNPIVGETATERFENLPGDPSEARTPLSLVALYGINSFLFLILSFFFLPESAVKIIGSFVGVVLGIFGLKSLNPRETSDVPRTAQRRVVTMALVLAIVIQGTLVAIGFSHPCKITAIPGSTVFVDGKFLERTAEPPADDQRKAAADEATSPENIRPWLKPQTKGHWLRWDTHEIKVTKKWYVDADRSQESIQNVFVDFGQFCSPRKAFEKWFMQTEQRPYLKIDYGGRGQEKELNPPTADPAVPSDIPFTEDELNDLVEAWDQVWTTAFDQKDVYGHKRTEPYIARLQLIEDRSASYFEFQIRDWTSKPVKPLPPIRPTLASMEPSSPSPTGTPTQEELKRLSADSLRVQVFTRLLAELGFPDTIKIKIAPGAKQVVSLSQQLTSAIEKSATPTPAPIATPIPSPTMRPTSTPAPTGSPGATPAASPLSSPTPTATAMASASPSIQNTIKELENVAKQAADDGRLDVTVSAQQQLASALTEIEKRKSPPDQNDSVQQQLQNSQRVVADVIRRKTQNGRVYLHISDELQRELARKIGDKLKASSYAVIGIQNVGGRAYIPDTAEVRYFASDPARTKQTAEDIVSILKEAGVRKARASYVIPSVTESKQSVDITTHFEIWFARDSFGKTGD